MYRGRALYIAQVVLVVFPSFFLFGYNQVNVGGLLSFASWIKAFPQIDTTSTIANTKSHNSVIQGVYVSSFTLGGLAGSLSCSFIGDVLGRRKTVLIGGIFTLIGEIVSCTAFQLPQLVVGRIITGIGIGVLFTMVPIWQAECSKPTNRGKHVVIDGIFISSGYAMSYWVNFGFSHMEEQSASWRVPVAMPAVLSIVLISSIFLFPESPRWLVHIGERANAAKQLARIGDTGIDADEVQREIASIEFSLEETAQTAASVKDIFSMKDGKLFYRFMLCLGIQFWIQMTGASVISTYSTTIFRENLGLSSPLSRILGASALTWKFLASFVSFFTIDRFGRRKLFLFCGVGVTLCMTCMAITSSFSSRNHGASVADAFFLFLFNFFFPIGLLGPSFLYCTEVAPIRLRVAMTSISTANHWLWYASLSPSLLLEVLNFIRNFVVQMITPVALANIGYQYYIVYALIGLTFVGSVYFFYPETMGQSLEQLDDLFQNDISILETVKMAKRLSKMPGTAMPEVELKGQVEQVEYSEQSV
ncbi:unnamed protein product [Penicillium salamii]|uniref:Major facilitator superfamily (MFS) profile domain-containing protein n=1 Tax=Penicillium salamii TaxID=1612424 RepID=A0A9W4IE47_9EURO|nr:unnamed protein product [Penicillium salamii]CAG7963933.1 unnamed protein product [Penicillium salamii]CAG7967281.1 unnamed protein product [Penicillium salamii]CAG7985152.1 unnamed protein product [Penicillium salamii]CAG8123457.1 unnamed protein product [Penicillium salamii]